MQFCYETYRKDGVRYDTTARSDDVIAKFDEGDHVVISDMLNSRVVGVARSEEEMLGLLENYGRTQWAAKVLPTDAGDKIEKTVSNAIKAVEGLTLGQLSLKPKDHINPSHYQGYIDTGNETLQWLEAMQYLPHFREPKSFLAAVELQFRKYLDRSGGKDNELQEAKKALWYMKFHVAYMANGCKPIRVVDIPKLLGEVK